MKTLFTTAVFFLIINLGFSQNVSVDKVEIKKLAQEITQSSQKQKLTKDQKKLISILKPANNIDKMTDSQILDFEDKLTKFNRMMERKNNGYGGKDGRKSCVSEYDKCMEDHGCQHKGLICLCCIPCSVIYSRCIVGL